MHSYCTLTYDEDLQAYRIMLADHAGRPSRLFLTEDSLAQMIADAAVVYADRHHCAMFATDGTIYVVSAWIDDHQIIDLVTVNEWEADSRYRLLALGANKHATHVRYAEYVDGRAQKMKDAYIDPIVTKARIGE